MENRPNLEREYKIGKLTLTYPQFCHILSLFPPLREMGTATVIHGPFDGKINTIYRVGWSQANSTIFRARISQAFRYEPIVKEKILYPFLDGTLGADKMNLRAKIKSILNKHSGSYIFSANKPPIVPVQDLLYFYEPDTPNAMHDTHSGTAPYPRVLAEFPYLCSVKNYLPGITFYDYLQTNGVKEKNHKEICHLFRQAGNLLGKMHTVQFSGFYDKITDIGKPEKPGWEKLFHNQWTSNLEDASQYKPFAQLMPGIKKFYQDNSNLIGDTHEAVLFHNDYQAQNIILTPPKTRQEQHSISGIIDFDNWRIGPRAQDFVKMEYWTIQGNSKWLEAFYQGYSELQRVSSDLKRQISVYKLLWFMLVYAFEMDKVKKQEINQNVDGRFPAAEQYLKDIETILEDYL